MKQDKQYSIDLWLFISSTIVFLYLLFMDYAVVNNWDNTAWGVITELTTIPMLFLGCVIPIVVIYRLITNKAQNRSLAILSMFFSLMTVAVIAYLTFYQ